MRSKLFVLWALSMVLLPQTVHASGTLRRYLLAVGANTGGPERVVLKYAVSDAERFAEIMVRMGGVDPADRIILRQPESGAMEAALANFAAEISKDSSSADKSELLFYYSGHADESGLRAGKDRISYAGLRERMEAIPADVRITVLDACASGVITRLKGGERRQPFLVDVSSDTEGYAFLTSSSENEAAQESDVIGASFFTHYLVSGLRGAADASGDGRISLTEAYHFAFNETLARTTETMGGAQHPAYDMNLSGTGDVVMTDVRRTSAGIILAKELEGRFYIRDRNEHLVAELLKPRGRTVTLGLEAGGYQIHLERRPELFVARVEVGLNEVLMVKPEHFETTDRMPTVVRGGTPAWPPRPGFMGPLAGRSRIRLVLGWHDVGLGNEALEPSFVSTTVEAQNLLLGFGYSRWIREDLAVGIDFLALQANVGSSLVTQVQEMFSLRLGVRKYLPRSALRTPFRPFASLAVGALLASTDKSEIVGAQVAYTAQQLGAFGAEIGLGVDFILAHRLMLGSKLSYNLVTDFPEPFAGRKNYSSMEFGVSIGWLFGKSFHG